MGETKKIVVRNLYKTDLLAVWAADGELIRIKNYKQQNK